MAYGQQPKWAGEPTAYGQPPKWAACGHEGCIGVRLPTTALCLAHAAEQAPDALDAELKRIGAGGTVDARGVVISAELLGRLLAAVPHKDDRPVFTDARFYRARFEGEAQFQKASFEGWTRFGGARFQGEAQFQEASFQGAWFEGARFEGVAHFDEASFGGWARFEGASFQHMAQFSGASFEGLAQFDYARFFEGGAWFGGTSYRHAAEFKQASFEGVAWFWGARFQGRAVFERANVQGAARFNEASFEGQAWFDGARFQDEVAFSRASFQHGAEFHGASFQGEAWFDEVSFERARQVGPLVARQLVLDGAVFGARVQLEATAAAVCARRVQFPAGVHLRLRYASVVLDDANLAAPAILAGVPSPFLDYEWQEQQIAPGWQRLPPGPREQRWRPRLLSVRRADVAGLRLAGVDLRACRFVGAHNLDRLRIEGAPLFARTTGWWRARRRSLAEEQHWRARRPSRWRATGWYPRACQPPASTKTDVPDLPEPTWLAALYRDLRKGREDAKDEPGAADFYYGECEMRRHGAPRFSIERWILTLYWLVSGYALRASRAVLAWVVLVVAGAAIFAGLGFKPAVSPQIVPVDVSNGQAIYEKRDVPRLSSREQLPEAVAFSAESTVSLLRAPDRALTLPGRWAQMVLRILGPVLFGLAVLSLRGRVRR